MPLGMVKVMIIANAPSNIKYQGPRSARNPRNKKNTIVPINGPSIRPMPPIMTMKTTNAVQSFTLNAASGLIRSFCIEISAPTLPVAPAVRK